MPGVHVIPDVVLIEPSQAPFEMRMHFEPDAKQLTAAVSVRQQIIPLLPIPPPQCPTDLCNWNGVSATCFPQLNGECRDLGHNLTSEPQTSAETAAS